MAGYTRDNGLCRNKDYLIYQEQEIWTVETFIETKCCLSTIHFFSAYDLLNTNSNRYLADTDTDRYCFVCINLWLCLVQ